MNVDPLDEPAGPPPWGTPAQRLAAALLVAPALVLFALDWGVNPNFVDVPLALVVWVVAGMMGDIRLWRVAGTVGALAYGLAALPALTRSSVQLLVYEVDGASFDVLDANVAALRGFDGLRKEGAEAGLSSTAPLDDAWRVLETGAPDGAAPTFWERAARAGHTVVAVPCDPAAGTATLPGLQVLEELAGGAPLSVGRAARLVHAGVRLTTVARAIGGAIERAVDPPDPAQIEVAATLLRDRAARDVFVRAVQSRRATVAGFCSTAVAAIGRDHLTQGGGEPVLDAYAQIDATVAELRWRVPTDAWLFVVSARGLRVRAEGGGEPDELGLYLVRGPGVPEGGVLAGLGAEEVAPVVLAALGVAR